jgi:phosphatidate phosphatase APP1
LLLKGEVRIVSTNEKRVIVSDIDDTVLVSHSTNTFRKLRLMLFKNALTRVPFKGVANFYCALERGAKKDAFNPIFYVSSSEWNLYDLLENFFDHNRIPKGVFMLRKLEHSIYKFWKSGQGSHEHKYDKIKFLLQLFDKQNFILIGDSGQKDPGIYTRLAQDFPGRIESIYIRKIGSGTYRQTIEDYNNNLGHINTTYLQVEDTIDAARHALEKGYIHEDALTEHLCHTDDESLTI